MLSRLSYAAAARGVKLRCGLRSVEVPQVRQFHLLPSQAARLLADANVGQVTSRCTNSPHEAAQIVQSLPGRKGTLRADALDADPARASFTFGERGHTVFHGLAHEVIGGAQAHAVASLLLGTGREAGENPEAGSQWGFRSTSSPYGFKTFRQVLVEGDMAGETQSSEHSHLEILLQADREPQQTQNGSDQVHSGLTFSFRVLPGVPPPSGSSLPITTIRKLTPELVNVVNIDVAPLMKEAVPPFRGGGQEQSVALVEALECVGNAAAESVLKQLETCNNVTLQQPGKIALADFVRRVVALFWTTDAERFALTISVPSASTDPDPTTRITSHQLEFDDYALGRQEYLRALHEQGHDSGTVSAFTHTYTASERQALSSGLIYRAHPGGDIALFGYGAGMGMGTFDGVTDAGGKPVNFFDGGGGANEKNAYEAMEIIAGVHGTAAVFVNIFGGITRSDLVAKGILRAIRTFPSLASMPFIVRFRGNKAEEAQQVFREAGLADSNQVIIENDFAEATRKVTEVARRRKADQT